MAVQQPAFRFRDHQLTALSAFSHVIYAVSPVSFRERTRERVGQ